jgi:hypothetical protein
MKANPFVGARGAVLAVFVLAKVFCTSCPGQGDPLNSWTLTWSGNPALQKATGIAYGNGMFVAVGNGARLVSSDGVNWTTYISPPIINTGNPAPGVAYGGGAFVEFGTFNAGGTNYNYILKSTNGLIWTPIFTYTNGNAVYAAAYGNNTWVFLGPNQIITASTTSSNWNWTQFNPSFSPASIVFGNGTFAVVNYNSSYVLSSADGITWQYDSPFPVINGYNPGAPPLAYGNGVFVAMAIYYNTGTYFYKALVSSNLVQWSTNTWVISTSYYPGNSPLAFGGNQFIAALATSPNSIWTSADGVNWTNRLTPNGTSACAYGQGTFVVGDTAGIYQSGVFAQTNSPSAALAISTYPGVTLHGTAGAIYQIQYTTNLGSPWLPLTNFSLPYNPYLWIDPSSPVHGQRFYRSVQLP